jgi:hypothetical protein
MAANHCREKDFSRLTRSREKAPRGTRLCELCEKVKVTCWVVVSHFLAIIASGMMIIQHESPNSAGVFLSSLSL